MSNTAPASVPTRQTVKLTAQAPDGEATATITLSPKTWVDITPGYAVAYPAEPIQFTAETANVGTAGVIWSISPTGAGTINAAGLYTAPLKIPALQKVLLTATSVMNPSIGQTITMWISPPPFVLFVPQHDVNTIPGGTTTAEVAELAADQFPHPVTFTVTGLPQGFSAKFARNELVGTGSRFLTVTVSPEVKPGAYQLTVTGTDTIYAGNHASQTLTVTVLAPR